MRCILNRRSSSNFTSYPINPVPAKLKKGSLIMRGPKNEVRYYFSNFIFNTLKIFLQIIFIYPLLQKHIGISNLRLALFGLTFKIGSVIILAFTKTSLTAFMSIFLSIYGRFVPTGLRAIASACVNIGEQGKKKI